MRLVLVMLIAGFVVLPISSISAQEQANGQLATAAQNPVADLVSLPLQNNTFFGIGPDDDVANVLNVQPVIPFALSEDWNLITRTIVPLIYVPDLTGGLADLPEGKGRSDTFGLGDINATGFLSPAKPGAVIWGLGPSLTLPTATAEEIGTERWSAGPSVVVLSTPTPWVYGALLRQLWSFAGDDEREKVSQLLLQPFLNYNLPGGWYLVSAPIVTANWEAASGNRWNVPIGGGAGRVFAVGGQPVNTSVQAYAHVEHPTIGPEWSLRVQVQLLFPK